MCYRTEKAWRLIKHEIELQSRSQFPSDDMAIGMIQMAYAQGDINGQQELELTQEAAETVRNRRTELRNHHIQACIQGARNDNSPRSLAG